MPIDGRLSGMVDDAYLSEQIPVVGKEVHQTDSCAEEIPVAVSILGRHEIQFLPGLLVILFAHLVQVSRHRPVHPKAQLR